MQITFILKNVPVLTDSFSLQLLSIPFLMLGAFLLALAVFLAHKRSPRNRETIKKAQLRVESGSCSSCPLINTRPVFTRGDSDPNEMMLGRQTEVSGTGKQMFFREKDDYATHALCDCAQNGKM